MNKAELEKEVKILEYRLSVKINCENTELDRELRGLKRDYKRLQADYINVTSKMVKYLK